MEDISASFGGEAAERSCLDGKRKFASICRLFCKYLSSLNWSRLLLVIRFARIYYSARGVNKSIKVLSQTFHNLEDIRKAKIHENAKNDCVTRATLLYFIRS